MAFDIMSGVLGGVATIIIILVALFILIGLLFGRIREQLRIVLGKLYSRVSLMLIAIFDVVAAFDPSQSILGIALAPIAGGVVFLSEWGLHEHFAMNRLGASLIHGVIAAIIIAIPLPIAGLFVAWFGLYEPKKTASWSNFSKK